MLKVLIDKKNSIYLNLVTGKFAGDRTKAKRAIEAFAENSTLRYTSFGYGFGELLIGDRKIDISPGDVDIEMMLDFCGIDKVTLSTQAKASNKALFERTPSVDSNSPFTSPGVLNFASITIQMKETIGYEGGPESSQYPYLGEKPGGTDVGHLISYLGLKFVVKAGISLSLLGQALVNVVNGDKNKAINKLGYIIDNYARILKMDSADIPQLKERLLPAFEAYLLSEHGQKLQELIIKSGHKISSHDVYQIYLYLTHYDTRLKDVIGLPAFADVVSGCHSQQFNNVFYSAYNRENATHKLFMQPKENPGIFQGSRFLEDSCPFDKFLLEPFKNRTEDLTDDEWIDSCTNKLEEQLKGKALVGLCGGILIRHILGESADNGPDNMLISERGITNIDLTGFRYSRKDAFKGALGWADTLALESSDELLNRLFHPTVFKNRFMENLSLPDHSKAAVFQAIIKTIKKHVHPVVVGEVAAVRVWLAGMDSSLVNASIAKATKQVYENLNEKVKFSEVHLDALIAFNQQFITEAITVAKECEANLADKRSERMGY